MMIASTTPVVMAPLTELSGCMLAPIISILSYAAVNQPQPALCGSRSNSRRPLYAAPRALGECNRNKQSMAIAQIDPIEFWMVREVAHQDSVHIHVEAGTCRPGAQYGQFILGTGRAQVGPVIDDVKVGARSTLEFTAAQIAFAQRDASRKRPRLQFQRRQRQPHAKIVQHERFLAHAGAPALSDLVSKTRARAVLETQHLQAQPLRTRNVAERLAGVLVRVKHPETLLEIRRIHTIDRLRSVADGEGGII